MNVVKIHKRLQAEALAKGEDPRKVDFLNLEPHKTKDGKDAVIFHQYVNPQRKHRAKSKKERRKINKEAREWEEGQKRKALITRSPRLSSTVVTHNSKTIQQILS